ncbi:MAG: zinc-binding alcohol dehydrogenase [Vicinamibacterales bacterium]
MSDALAFWIVAPGRGEIRREVLSPRGPADVLVRTLHSGVSRGTEALVFHGRVPPAEYQRMRAPFQAGDFPAPVKYGYACVGVVDAGPAALAGRRVFVLHPHQTRFVVPADAVHPLPDAVPSRRAVLAANLETALNAVWDAALLPGSRVAVVGGGTVGCLVAWLAGRIPGCAVQLVDVRETRATTAATLGVAFAPPAEAAADCDVVFHASATGDGLATALGLAGLEATVVELSWYGTTVVPAALGEAFHSRRLTLKSSQVGHVAPAQRPRWSHARRLQAALDLLADDAVDALLTGESDFASLPADLPAVLGDGAGVLCHTVRYPAD